MPRRTLSPEEYTIGIVCAMDFEQNAVQATFDKRHGQTQSMAGDKTNYVFGKIGEHNVAVASLSKTTMMHTRSAATVITDMVRSFPMIKVGLLVGIGGGTWSERAHIGLKGVVVSLPGHIHGGVVQWEVHSDDGKTHSCGTDHLAREEGMISFRTAAAAAAYAKHVLCMPAADLATIQSASEAIEPSKQVVYIAMPKNCQFVGRRAELQILKRRMITVQDCQSLAVTELGGIGKTELVLYFE